MNCTKTQVFNFNYTGRKFICISLENDYIDNVQDHFTSGNVYLEAKLDPNNVNLLEKEDDGCIILCDDFNLPLYSDASCYVLLEKEIDPLALLPLNLN